MIAKVIYILCAATSLATAVILLRNYIRSNVRFLLWSGLCFVGLAVGNILLVVDMLLWPWNDLSMIRLMPAVIGYGILIYGCIWDVA
jgi:drug/metabolite transporter (DMT)-like permease